MQSDARNAVIIAGITIVAIVVVAEVAPEAVVCAGVSPGSILMAQEIAEGLMPGVSTTLVGVELTLAKDAYNALRENITPQGVVDVLFPMEALRQGAY